MNPDVKLEKLKEMLSLLSEGLTREEFTTSFKEVVKVVKDIKDTNTKEWSLIHEAMKKIPEKMMSEAMFEMRDGLTKTEKRLFTEVIGEMEKRNKEHAEMVSQFASKSNLEIKLLKADREAIIEDALAKVPKPPPPDFSHIRRELEEVASKLEEVTKSLDTRIEKIEKTPQSTGFRVNNAPIYTTLTPDGATKVFIVPKNRGGIVIGSDFPTVLMEGAGFTLNATRTQLTLTVDNAPSLNSQLVFIGNSIFNI